VVRPQTRAFTLPTDEAPLRINIAEPALNVVDVAGIAAYLAFTAPACVCPSNVKAHKLHGVKTRDSGLSTSSLGHQRSTHLSSFHHALILLHVVLILLMPVGV
jgi:hypothetical protein